MNKHYTEGACRYTMYGFGAIRHHESSGKHASYAADHPKIAPLLVLAISYLTTKRGLRVFISSFEQRLIS